MFNCCQVFDGPMVIHNSRGISFECGCIAVTIYQTSPSAYKNMISNCIFHKSYGGGSISDYTNLILKNNHFYDGSDNTTINN